MGRPRCTAQPWSPRGTTASRWRWQWPHSSRPVRPRSRVRTASPSPIRTSLRSCRSSPVHRDVFLYGDPVSRSLSPVMQNAAFEALGIDCRYVLREVSRADLARALAELRGDERILGANVTIPHKESVIAFLDELDPQAARIGAVNTISRQGRKLKGWNTDVVGFQRALAEADASSPSPLAGEG